MTDAIPTDEWKLWEARNWLRDRVEDGASCPCCTQRAQVYKRKINSTMTRALISLYRAEETNEYGFVHAPSLPGDTHEMSQLAWWDLIQEEKIQRPDGGRAGWWRMTETGSAWVRGAISVPTYARIYDSRVLALVGDPCWVKDALGTRFSYHDLMEGK